MAAEASAGKVEEAAAAGKGSLPTFKLWYFPNPGKAEPVRLAFTLAGIPFEDYRFDYSEWPAIKPTTPFGQVPVLEVDGVKYPMSGAQLRYVGRLGGLYPADPLKAMEVEVALGLIGDLDRVWIPCEVLEHNPRVLARPRGYADTDEGKARVAELRANFMKVYLPAFGAFFTKQLESHREGGDGPCRFIAGDLSIADCALLPDLLKFTSGHYAGIPTTCWDDFPVVKEYIGRMMALPALKAYMAKQRRPKK